MRFEPLPIPGACTVELDKRGDDRGFFARLYCEREYAQAGLPTRFVQINNSASCRRGTLRGMHYQLPDAAEVKVVRCVQGALFDVIVDLRPDSPAFRRWHGVELSADNRRMMVVPRGCAHGFLTLAPDTEALYLVSAAYAPDRERGLRYDDPAIRVEWPFQPDEVSLKDRQWPALDADFHGLEALRGLR